MLRLDRRFLSLKVQTLNPRISSPENTVNYSNSASNNALPQVAAAPSVAPWAPAVSSADIFENWSLETQGLGEIRRILIKPTSVVKFALVLLVAEQDRQRTRLAGMAQPIARHVIEVRHADRSRATLA